MIPVPLVPIGVILGIVATIGSIGNLMMVLLFFRFNKLRSPCHYLITVNCLGDGLHNIGQFIFVAYMFGEFESTQSTCFLLNIPTLLGVISCSCWMLALGIDRLIACKWPVKYRALSGRAGPYILVQCICPLVYTSAFVFMSFSEISDTSVICSVPAAMGSKTFVIWSTANLLVNGVTIVIYTGTYCFLLKKDTAAHGGHNFRTVFKSIFVSVALVVFGWSVTCVANTFVVLFVADDFGKQLVNLYAGIPVNIACASNVFIFYAINNDYRKCIKRLFGAPSSQVAAYHSETKVSTTNAPLPQCLNETNL